MAPNPGQRSATARGAEHARARWRIAAPVLVRSAAQLQELARVFDRLEDDPGAPMARRLAYWCRRTLRTLAAEADRGGRLP